MNQNGISDFFDTDSRTGAPINPGDVELYSLSYLSLNRNNLTKVPSVCKHMPALKQLHLHINKLTEVRELCRPEFAGLEVLDIGNNRIAEIPIALPFYLAKLATLAMVNNDCLNLPHWLGSHKSIQAVNVEGNPMKRIRRQVVEKGSQAILLYLRDKFVAGTDD